VCGEDVSGFAEYLSNVRGLSPATRSSYGRDLQAFTGYCKRQDWPVAQSLSRLRVGMYLVERTEERKRREGDAPQLGARSAARLVSGLKAYAQYLVFSGVLKENPLVGFKPPKYSRGLPPYFSSDEIRLVVCAFDDAKAGDALKLRNAAILHLLYGTGMRVSECAALGTGDLELAARLVQVLGKGRRQRIVPFGDHAAGALNRYLGQGRPLLASAGSADSLWLNQRGGGLSARAMRNVLNAAIQRIAMLKHLSPHKLRHACATHLLEGGANIRVVQELLGHESINTTQVYTRITRRHLREVYERTHPRADRKDEAPES
jgi:site-specific recombinase XerD